ncbi:hypothetical protein ACIQAA_05135 [Neobacillus sp. NPDC093182]|uniref:hypothetical protein n=1 Tax=Neobacillus sp. NPDC093182 TaxID=3364297 RepID=UPI00382341CE
MERIILWTLLLVGITLLLFSLRKPFIKDWILIFLLNAYLSTLIGVLVVEENKKSGPMNEPDFLSLL